MKVLFADNFIEEGSCFLFEANLYQITVITEADPTKQDCPFWSDKTCIRTKCLATQAPRVFYENDLIDFLVHGKLIDKVLVGRMTTKKIFASIYQMAKDDKNAENL